jgi:hypothetical protein
MTRRKTNDFRINIRYKEQRQKTSVLLLYNKISYHGMTNAERIHGSLRAGAKLRNPGGVLFVVFFPGYEG